MSHTAQEQVVFAVGLGVEVARFRGIAERIASSAPEVAPWSSLAITQEEWVFRMAVEKAMTFLGNAQAAGEALAEAADGADPSQRAFYHDMLNISDTAP